MEINPIRPSGTFPVWEGEYSFRSTNFLISSKKKDPRGSFSVVGSLRFLSFHHLFWRVVHGGAEGFVFFVLCRELEAAGECGIGFELEVVLDEVVVFEVGVFDHGEAGFGDVDLDASGFLAGVGMQESGGEEFS